MGILKGVIRKGIFIILPSVLIAAFFEWKKLPLGIIFGAGFGILNLWGLQHSVGGLTGSGDITARIIFLSMTRLVIMCALIGILLWFKIINVFGMLFGFTVIFVLTVLEGIKSGKRD
jgi:hypothetical protein